MICLDTNVVIALLNQSSGSIHDRLEAEWEKGEVTAISALVVFELLYGAAMSVRRRETAELVHGFLTGPVRVLAFDGEDAEEAGAIRAELEKAGTPIGPYDILIAAQARRRGATLVTANVREFARVARLRFENWSG